MTPAAQAIALRREWAAERDPKRKAALWREYERAIARVTCEAVLGRTG